MNFVFSLKVKLLAIVGLALVCLGSVIFFSYSTINEVSKTVMFFGKERLPLTSYLGEIKSASNGVARFMWLANANPANSPARENALKRVENYLAEMSANLVQMEKYNLLARSKEIISELKVLTPKLSETLKPTIAKIRDGRAEYEKEIKEELLTKMPPIAVKITDLSNELGKNVSSRNDAVLVETETIAKSNIRNLLIFSIVGSFVFAFIGFIFASKLSTQLGTLAKTIGESSGQVANASNTIASASSSLSQATSEQAASLEETASSIEEMSSMVSKNTDNAKNTAAISTQSQAKAEKGNVVIEKMVSSMNEISKSNNEIAEIVKVIKEIGNKTKVINDIVFQTKLLSFNASVEAARAGEHGKGFAVVAEEVGNLAQMSGTASKEISTLLESSIHKVESIVGDTKAKVDSGVNTAKECGDVFAEIVGDVKLVSQMSNDISSASQEQAQGISEITKAVSQLDQVTQQNAATSEETSNEAEELSAQANALKEASDKLISIISGDSSGGAKVSVPVISNKREKVKTKVFSDKKSNVVHLKVSDQNQGESIDDVPARKHAGFKDV